MPLVYAVIFCFSVMKSHIFIQNKKPPDYGSVYEPADRFFSEPLWNCALRAWFSVYKKPRGQSVEKVFAQTKRFVKKPAKPAFLHLVAARVPRKRREDARKRGLFCLKTLFLDSLPARFQPVEQKLVRRGFQKGFAVKSKAA